ncbi:PKD domain-containing protein [Aeromicrobium sp.]|uniref:PKD domain-containing protein n=1 Tax=Aeromicrobium sp. TaxID=1871063 RepID=UPI0028B13F0D|nr:PKD domain-containing protein [Aeromicrobium sp.]
MSRTSLRVSALILSGVGLLAPALVAPMAHADLAPTDPSLPTTVTADALPTVQIDGVVWDQEVVGNTVYVAGQFSNARPAGAAPGTNTTPRANMLAYNLTTGALIADFKPVFDAQVKTLSISPDGSTLYAGGSFSKVDGQNRYRIAALNPANGAVVGGTPGANSTVNTIHATADAIYVGGNFSTLGSASRVKAGSFIPRTSTVLPFNPIIPDGNLQGIVTSPDGSRVAFGGAFTQVNGSSNPGFGLGLVDAATGRTNFPFSANAAIRDAGTEAAILSMKADANGFYGAGYHFGRGGNLEGSFAASWEGDLQWVEDCHGDTYDIEPRGNVVYQASHKHYCDNLGTGGFPQTEPDWSFQHGTAVTKFATGTSRRDIYGYGDHPGRPSPTLLNWFPDFMPGTFTGKNQGPWDVESNGDYVVFGGEFLRVNNTPQQGIVRFARKGISPENQGPRDSGAGLGVQARSLANGTVRVSWPGTRDRDNATLKYELFKDTTTNKVYESTQTARFWEVEGMGFTDTGLTPGSQPRYRLRVTDPSGNQANSDWVTATVASGTALGTYAQRVLSDGPTKYWRLSESDRQVIDWAGTDDTTVGTGATRGAAGAISDGTNDAATTFNAANSSVTVSPTRIYGPQKFSLEAWFKTPTGTTGGGKIAGFGNNRTGDSNSNDRHLYVDSNGRLVFGIYDGSNQQTVTGATGVRDNNWHHAVGTFENGTVTLYLDGKRLATRTGVGAAQRYWGHWRVGGDRTWSGNKYFRGQIDEFAVYPKALTAAQVDAHWQASGRASNLPQPPADNYGKAVFNSEPDLYWRLGETSGTTAEDASTADSDGSYLGNYTLGRPGAVPGNAALQLGRAVPGGIFGIGAKAGGNVVSKNAFTNPQVFSQSVWIRTTDTSGGRIFGFGSSANGSTSSNYDRHLYMLDDGRVRFGVYNGSTVTIDSAAALNDGQWHHVVSTFGSGGMRLYVDGVLNSSDPNTSAENYTGYWKLGGDTTWGGNSQVYFNGDVDEAAVFSSQLPAQTVRAHFLAAGGTLPNAAPTASFTSAANGASVAFDASGSSDPDGSIASYAWNFGDGETGTGVSPTHVYDESGTYVVTLTVTDDANATATTTRMVNVAVPNQAPQAGFTHEVDGLAVAFTSTSGDPDGSIASYDWDFGDGTTSTQANPSHTYANGAVRTVSLTVTDDGGLSNTVTRTVDPDAAPVADFTVARNALSISLTSTATDDDAIASHAWTFGDGGTSTQANPTHSYGAAGTYPVTLTVKDAAGQTHAVTKSVTVEEVAPGGNVARDAFGRSVTGGWGTADLGGAWAVASGPTAFSVGDGVGRVSLPAGGTREVMLSGSAARETDLTFDYTLQKSGTGGGTFLEALVRAVDSSTSYRAKLVTRSDNRVRLDLVRVAGGTTTTLGSQIVPNLTMTAGETLEVRVQAVGTGGTDLRAKVWKAGQAEPSAWTMERADATAALQASGRIGFGFYVSGSTTNAPQVYEIDDLTSATPGPQAPNQPPAADFTVSGSGTTANFDAGPSTDSDGSIVAWAWQFGDGQTGTGATTSHTYPAQDASYQVTLTVTDDDGATHSRTRTVTVTAPQPGGDVARDAFGRSVTGGWGTADAGGAWSVSSGSAAAFSVAGGAGRVSLPAGGGREITLSGSSSRQSDLTFDYTLEKSATGGGTYLEPIVRSIDGSNSYRAKILTRSDGTVRVDLVRVAGGTSTTLGARTAPDVTMAAGETLKVRVQAVGASSTDLRIKVWKAGTTEPAAWTLERADSTAALQASGRLGLWFYVSGSTTNGPQGYAIDELTVKDAG